MIKAIIIDDEPNARILLKNKIEENFKDKITVLAEANGIKTGIKAIKEHHPDLVFLDIEMPEGTGFDLLEQLESVNFEVIFVTAYNEYALKAIEFSAFAYLLKPVIIEKLQKAIQQYENQLKKQEELIGKKIKVLLDNYKDHNTMSQIIVPNIEGFKVIEVNTINYLDGDGSYTNLMLENKSKVTATKLIGEYEKLLRDNHFFRIHQSTIINLNHVKQYFKGNETVEMKNGVILKISKHRKAEFMAHFKKHFSK